MTSRAEVRRSWVDCPEQRIVLDRFCAGRLTAGALVEALRVAGTEAGRRLAAEAGEGSAEHVRVERAA